MLAQKVIDEVFACLRPYLSLRRLFLSVFLILLSSRSGLDFFNNKFSELSLKEGVVSIFKAVSEAEFLLAFPVFFICIIIAPHLNHFLAVQSFKFNVKLKYMDDFFDKAELESRDDLEEKVADFIVFSKRLSALLETFCACSLAVILYYFINMTFWHFVILSLSIFSVMWLSYVEGCSKVLREYAKSVYLMRLDSQQ